MSRSLTTTSTLAIACFAGLGLFLHPMQAGDDPWETVPPQVQAAALLAAKDVVMDRDRRGDEPAALKDIEDEIGVVAYQIVQTYMNQRGAPRRR